MPRYGEDARHAAMLALGGAVQASNAYPVKVPGWTVLYAVAAPAVARARVNIDATRIATLNTVLTTGLRRGAE
ncbi:hypothetical protein Ari01nite_58780 [Paractinoplanes rishiriensis]|uniref:Uncharacterized protein n=1 Tax=Paractinoplanes rishiriensis TaxID=1050105 RepID=A0A919K182_9ACTN|nr:hypothetical protein Ari01nite_58780 [Actinoplanes rishiriensis]